MKRLVSLLFLFIVFTGCNHKGSVAYESGISVESKHLLNGEILNDSFMFSWPRDVIIIDSLLLVHDSYKQSDCFHIFNKYDGTHILSFGKKGRGPGEFLEVNSVNYNYDNRSITVFDPNSKKITIFDITNILRGEEPRFSEFTITAAPNFIKQVIRYKGEFITKGNSDKMRYGLWKPSDRQFYNIYTEFPNLTEDNETNWSITDYSVKVRLSPDRQKLVAGTYIGGVLEVFDINEQGFSRSAARYFFEPLYGYAEGAKPKWVTTTPETKLGFEDVFLTDEAIYGLVWEVEKKTMSQHRPSIIQFDYSGNPSACYTLSNTLESFAVDADHTLYGVGYNDEGEYTLNRYIL